MQRGTGAVVLAFGGVVLLVLAVRGSLGNTWKALLTPDAGGSGGSGPNSPAGGVNVFTVARGDVGTATAQAYGTTAGAAAGGQPAPTNLQGLITTYLGPNAPGVTPPQTTVGPNPEDPWNVFGGGPGSPGSGVTTQ